MIAERWSGKVQILMLVVEAAVAAVAVVAVVGD
jgi:hypothetical protein